MCCGGGGRRRRRRRRRSAGAYEIMVGERAALFSRCGAATERAGEATVGTLLGEALEVGYMVALNLVSTCLERRRRIQAECRGKGREGGGKGGKEGGRQRLPNFWLFKLPSHPCGKYRDTPSPLHI